MHMAIENRVPDTGTILRKLSARLLPSGASKPENPATAFRSEKNKRAEIRDGSTYDA